MGLFRKEKQPAFSFDPQTQEPAVRKSICTGEMTIGFLDKKTGRFQELMKTDRLGLETFCRQCGVSQIKTIY